MRHAGVDFYFGATLFEQYVLHNRLDQFRDTYWYYDCHDVEVSHGTIARKDAKNSEYVAQLGNNFTVISEVGLNAVLKSENMAPNK